MNRPRFAIYFAPEDDTALARFGWPWLGRRPDSTDDAPFPTGIDSDHPSIVSDPQLYGLHATLKPPFRLADGSSKDELLTAVHAFCTTRRSFETEPLALGEIDGFIALRPSGTTAAIEELASACVEQFDRFRAPLTAADIEKRSAHGLTPRQRDYLLRWGYPYVFEEFRFHLTLTGRLGDAQRAHMRVLLAGQVTDIERERVLFRSLCVFEQSAPGHRFVIVARFPFRDVNRLPLS